MMIRKAIAVLKRPDISGLWLRVCLLVAIMVAPAVYAQPILPSPLDASPSIEANLAPPAEVMQPLAHSIASEVTAPLPTETTAGPAPALSSDVPAPGPPLTVSTASPVEALSTEATTAVPVTTKKTKKKSAIDNPENNLPQNNLTADAPMMPIDPPPLPGNNLDNAIRNEAERSFNDAKKQRYQTTYERAYEGLVPLGPNEVRDTMSRYERTQRASVPPSTGQPRGQVRVKTLSLEPGSEPPTINISSGYVTTITILDATGEPWPIMDLGIGGNFEVSKTGGGNHVIRVMPLTRFGYGNLSVLLQDLSTPIIFKLASGGATVDYRFDARIPRMGPNAKLSLIDRKTKVQAGSAEIMSFLDNAPPPEAKRMRINGADSRTMAWLVDRRMFVRTPLTMLSPAWDSSVSSADGTTVYELTDTPILIMSDNGVLVRARVAPREEE
ncbi:MAG: hypothetical protein EB059_04195 [Alphaproteobacteria bacterium]|nr:hypothetical protein [Alphaproteobacteria bacterium]